MGGTTESLLTVGVRISSVIPCKDSEVYSSEGKYSMSRPESKDLLFREQLEDVVLYCQFWFELQHQEAFYDTFVI